MGQKLNKNKMNMPPTETGRSMVEMLGVLAIIGVLTVGGVAGFNYAMDKHNANEILDNVSKRAIALSPMALQGLDIDSHALDTEFGTAVGAFPVALDPDQTGFDIIVSKVPRGVCDHVLSGGLKMAEAILLGQDTVWEQGEKSDHTCAETDNEIVFAFNASLDGTQTAGGGNNVGPGNPGEACELGGQAGVETTVYLCDENAQGKCCKVAATTVCVPTGGDTSGLTLTDETNCPATTHKCTGDMKCVCQEACTGGRTQNPTDCSCTCPADKPNWNEHTETCVGCVSDTDCAERTDGKNSCDSDRNVCVENNNQRCLSNADCDERYFCRVSPTMYPGGGICTPGLGSGLNIQGLVYAPSPMNWESSNNWCQAQNKKLVGFETLSRILTAQTGKTITVDENYSEGFGERYFENTFVGISHDVWIDKKYDSDRAYIMSLGGGPSFVGSNVTTWRHTNDSQIHALCE